MLNPNAIIPMRQPVGFRVLDWCVDDSLVVVNILTFFVKPQYVLGGVHTGYNAKHIMRGLVSERSNVFNVVVPYHVLQRFSKIKLH
jgi:hypothetical protein